jgi:hypothetical protein
MAWAESDASDDEDTDMLAGTLADDLALMLGRVAAATYHHRHHDLKPHRPG